MSKQVSLASARTLAMMEFGLGTASLPAVHDAIAQLSYYSESSDGMNGVIVKKGLFDEAFKRIDVLNNEEIILNHHLCDLRCQLGDLKIFMSRLAPQEIEEQLDDLHQRLISLPTPSTKNLKGEKESLEQMWFHLYFLHHFPVALEISSDSFHDNFYFQTQREMEGLALPEKKKKEKFLTRLQLQQDLAEAIFQFGDFSKFYQLPLKDQKAIAKRVQIFGLGQQVPEEMRERIAGEVMRLFEQTLEII